MAYDLLASLTILLLLVICIFACTKIVKKGKGKGAQVTLVVATLFLLAIPIFGHSDLNRELQVKYLLNHLNGMETMAPESDQNAVGQLASAKKPLLIRDLHENRILNQESSDEYYEVGLMANGSYYEVTIVCYKNPLPWTIFESWTINKVMTSEHSL
ncbi:MAG TPA: hypothetical protein VFV52_09185 [Bacilli bacterium]|nr:hypothetical protein [Bacilli bacterium]